MKKLLPLFFSIALPLFSMEQPKDTAFIKNTWHGYDGKVGTADIQMALFFFENGQVKGNCVYKKQDLKIPVKGAYANNQISLTEMVNGKPYGYFKSTKWDSYSSNLCEGTWTDTLGKKTEKFIMHSIGYGGNSYYHMYPDVDSDFYLEDFMVNLKASVLNDDKEWLANNIKYPISIFIHTGKGENWKTLVIDSKKQFIANYNKIINKAMKNKIKNDVPYNLAGNNKGYMLGNNDILVSPQRSGDIKIITITN